MKKGKSKTSIENMLSKLKALHFKNATLFYEGKRNAETYIDIRCKIFKELSELVGARKADNIQSEWDEEFKRWKKIPPIFEYL